MTRRNKEKPTDSAGGSAAELLENGLNFPMIRDAVLQAATEAGGGSMVEYLRVQAQKHPGGFMTLLGKVLAMQEVRHEGGTFKLDFTVQFVNNNQENE
ncbi:hypothetical protein AAFN47_01310 [Hoeflea sp. CAU 1731]